MKKLFLLGLSLFILGVTLNAQTLDLPILENYDDAEEKGDGSMDAQSSDLEMIYENTDYHNGTGLRFQNANIPKGAIITKAYIQFTVDEDGNEGDVTLYLKAENADNSEQFTDDAFSVSSRDWSTDSIAWNPVAWAGNVEARGVDQQTSDVSSLVQSVIDRAGWVSGNPVTLNVVGPVGIDVNRIAMSSGDGNSPDGPTLHVEYEMPKAELIAHWAFEEGTGSTVADESGNGFDGELFNGSESPATEVYEWIDGGKVGKAVHLKRAYMKHPADKAFATNARTVTAWVKLNAELTEWGSIYNYADGTDDNLRLGFNKGSRQLYFFSPDLEFGAETPLELNVWYHCALTISGDGVVSMYLNGVLDGEMVGKAPISSNDLVEPGAFGVAMKSGWEGNVIEDWVLDEAYIYKGVLTQKQLQDQILESSLVAHWTFDEGAGLTVADGVSGFDGTLTADATWVDGISGSAIDFDGTGGYAVMEDTLAFSNSDFTISMWVKWNNGMYEGWSSLMEYHRGSWDDQWWGLFSNIDDAEGPFVRFSDHNAFFTPDTEKWYNVACTSDKFGVYKIYLDGVLITQETGDPKRQADLSGPLWIGGNTDGEVGNAIIDEVKYYNVVLSTSQIQADILNTDMVAHWMFNETTGNVAHDASGNGLDLVMAGTDDSNWVDGGAHFNGVDQYAILDKASTAANLENPNFTVSTWIKVEPDIVVVDNARIAGMDDPYGINLKGADNDGKVKVYVWDGTSWTGDYITSTSFSDGSWRHFAVTHDTVKGSVAYIDGIMAGTVANPDIHFIQDSYFAIAASISPADSTGKWFTDAGYKDFRMYDRVLSEEEIAILAGVAAGGVVGQIVKYEFEEFEPGDGNMVTDVSDNKRDGTINGPHTFKIEGVYGSAIEFNPDALDLDASSDPNNNCVVLPEDKLFASQEFTISAWINASNDTLVFDETWGEWGAIFAHDIGGVADYGLFYDPAGATMGVWSEGMGDAYLGGGDIQVGAWNHVALSMNPADSMLILYVNGVEEASTQVSTLLPASAAADTSCIGGSIERSKPFFGAIDEFEYFNVALDSADIAALAVRNYLLTTDVSMSGDIPLGTITMDPESEEGLYPSGTEVMLTTAAIDGYEFLGWEGDASGTDNPLTVTMDANMDITALFDVVKYDLAVTIVGEGTVAPGDGRYAGTLMLTATAADGYEFSGWSGEVGIIDSSSNMIFIEMNQDRAITATFSELVGIELYKIDFDLGNFPNPVTDQTTISYNINEQSNISLTIYDALGQQIKVLVNRVHQPGDYSVVMDAEDLSSGVYLYRLQSGSHAVTRRMIISK